MQYIAMVVKVLNDKMSNGFFFLGTVGVWRLSDGYRQLSNLLANPRRRELIALSEPLETLESCRCFCSHHHLLMQNMLEEKGVGQAMAQDKSVTNMQPLLCIILCAASQRTIANAGIPHDV